MNRSLGRYVLHDLLGRRAMVEVFRGTVRESWAPMVVKVLRADLVAYSEVVGRFVRERSILTSISHPNVVTVPRVLILELTRGQCGLVLEPFNPADGIRFGTGLPAVTGVPKLRGALVSNGQVTTMQMPELAESPTVPDKPGSDRAGGEAREQRGATARQ